MSRWGLEPVAGVLAGWKQKRVVTPTQFKARLRNGTLGKDGIDGGVGKSGMLPAQGVAILKGLVESVGGKNRKKVRKGKALPKAVKAAAQGKRRKKSYALL